MNWKFLCKYIRIKCKEAIFKATVARVLLMYKFTVKSSEYFVFRSNISLAPNNGKLFIHFTEKRLK